MSIWHLSRMVSLLRRLFKRNSAGQETIEKTTRREPEKQIGSEHNSRPKSIVPSSENDQSTITANDNMFSQRKRNVFARMYGKLKAQKRLKKSPKFRQIDPTPPTTSSAQPETTNNQINSRRITMSPAPPRDSRMLFSGLQRPYSMASSHSSISVMSFEAGLPPSLSPRPISSRRNYSYERRIMP